MGKFTYESLLNKTISDQRRELISYILFAFGVVIFGGAIILLGIFSPNALFNHIPNPTAAANWMFNFGGGFIITMVVIPVKEAGGRIKHLNTFRNIREEYANLDNFPKAERSKVQKHLEEMMLKYIEQELLN